MNPTNPPRLRQSSLFLLFLLFSLFKFLRAQTYVDDSSSRDSSAAAGAGLEPALPPHLTRQRLPTLPDSIRDFRFNAPSQSPRADITNSTEERSGGTPVGGYAEPTVDELTLSPLVLAVTVDGHVHALKRETGQWVWTLHDDGGVPLGGTEQAKRLKQAGAPVGAPLVRGVVGRRPPSGRYNYAGSPSNESGIVNVVPEEDEDEEFYVIEPTSQGDIYLFTKEGGGSLQKLPLSMQQLVERPPFTFPFDSSKVFVGKKESTIVGVDLRTGRLVGVFGAEAGWCEWDAAKSGTVKSQQEACDEDISRRPEDLLYMARSEYTVSIYAKSSATLLQSLTYTSYASSSLDDTLQSQWTRTPDGRYLQPMHDGSLICFLSGVTGLQWTIAFDNPVVSVFDIAIPPNEVDTNGNPTGEQAQPIMFEQPHPLPVEGLPLDFDGLNTLPESTFIGKVGDGLFAMSRDHFPLVAFAPQNGDERSAGGIDGGGLEDDSDEDEQLVEDRDRSSPVPSTSSPCRGIDCALGRHQVLVRPAAETSPAAPSSRLLIEAPPVSSAISQHPALPPPTSSSPYAPNRSTILASLYPSGNRISKAQAAAFGLILFVIISFGRKWTSNSRRVEEKLAALEREWQLEKRRNSEERAAAAKGLPATPPTVAEKEQQAQSEAEAKDVKNVVNAVGSPVPTAVPTTPATSPAAPSPLMAGFSPVIDTRSRSTSLSSLHAKELPALPFTKIDDDVGSPLQLNDDGESDGEGDAKDGPEGTPRKKGRRRRGKKTKKNAKVIEDLSAALVGDEDGEKGLNGLALSSEEVKDADEAGEVVPAVAVDSNTIGGLTVSETILGYGSHGTVVLRGEFQGRAVAVKRLLKDFVTIATHEVALLQESDDHPHVIRYYCKEQRDTFLYIALELCPASLYDLIDQPAQFPDLVRNLDSKRALRQITGGIRHLHKLKIVHRDIKPQNILVSTSKHGGVRMLISDFGLCKKLDSDESSFQQTVNHAAGSFGYRAPEVLRGQVDPNAGASGQSSGTIDSAMALSGSGSAGSLTTTDPSMRLTRSIDIFSLGCIFYYVLTGGEHPFGGRYEREMNILKGKLSLESLDGLGEEALEVQDLITRMVATDPRERPSAGTVLLHPFFWDAQKRLLFLCDASDRFEIMERDPPAPTLVVLESSSASVVGDDWQKAIDRTLLDNLGKYRKYDGASVRDLLRVLRNKKHHYQDLPNNVQKHLGDLPGGFLSYFTTRFPRLLLHVYETVSVHLSEEAMFASTFRIPDDS